MTPASHLPQGERMGSSAGVQPEILGDIEFCSMPFPYFVARQAFPPGDAGRLLRWLKGDVPWHLHQGDFFEQYECDLREPPVPEDCVSLFEKATLHRIRDRVAGLFGVEFRKHVSVAAHKLEPGQGIGLHNDDPQPGHETHRVVIQLNEGFRDPDGGHLVFFNSANTDDIHRIFRPLHNTAVAFALQRNSYHAVSEVASGLRYTLIYSFWAKGAAGQRDAARVQGDGETQRLIDFLQRMGAAQTKHSHASLLLHLVNTHKILRRWECPAYVCEAGLFHSIYGTEYFPWQTLSPDQRGQVVNLIGEKAENLVFLYSGSSRESLYRNLGRSERYTLHGFSRESETAISKEVLSDLLTLDLANTLEQLSRVRAGVDQAQSEKELYERAGHLLPRAAVEEMRSAYA